MTDVACPQCGHQNSITANFCSSCGAPLDTADDSAGNTSAMSAIPSADSSGEDLQLELDKLPPGIGMLVVTRGPNSGSRFALDEPLVTAGRHPDSMIFLDDITVSRRHAEVHKVDGGYSVADVGSLNGTYLNRERVEQAILTDGDELQIGTFKLLFLAGRE
ncbi:MAG: FHA domain-containing protein [Acidimicrobiales bacterium]